MLGWDCILIREPEICLSNHFITVGSFHFDSCSREKRLLIQAMGQRGFNEFKLCVEFLKWNYFLASLNKVKVNGDHKNISVCSDLFSLLIDWRILACNLTFYSSLHPDLGDKIAINHNNLQSKSSGTLFTEVNWSNHLRWSNVNLLKNS